MGANHDLIPVKDFGNDPIAIAKMEALGVTPADWKIDAEFPSLDELLSLLTRLDGFNVESSYCDGSSWQISIEGKQSGSEDYAILECLGYSGDRRKPHPFFFYRSDPETMVMVTRCLVEKLGPVILQCEYGEAVLVREDTPRDVEWREPDGYEG